MANEPIDLPPGRSEFDQEISAFCHNMARAVIQEWQEDLKDLGSPLPVGALNYIEISLPMELFTVWELARGKQAETLPELKRLARQHASVTAKQSRAPRDAQRERAKFYRWYGIQPPNSLPSKKVDIADKYIAEKRPPVERASIVAYLSRKSG